MTADSTERFSDSPDGGSDSAARVSDSAARVSDSLELPPGVTAALVLVRHGESTYVREGRFQGRHDPPLSSDGERQAALVAERLRDPTRSPALPIPGRPAAAIWHSPLARARQTAERIGQAHAGPVLLVPDDAFTEIGQGDWEGLTHDEVRAASGELLTGWRRDPLRWNAPGGERLLDARSRVRGGVARLLESLASEPAGDAVSPVPGYTDAATRHPWAILVAHDGVFRLALLSLLEVPIERFWSFPFVLCGITVVELRGGRAVLLAHNLAEHLAPLAAEAVAATEARDRTGAL